MKIKKPHVVQNKKHETTHNNVVTVNGENLINTAHEIDLATITICAADLAW